MFKAVRRDDSLRAAKDSQDVLRTVFLLRMLHGMSLFTGDNLRRDDFCSRSTSADSRVEALEVMRGTRILRIC